MGGHVGRRRCNTATMYVGMFVFTVAVAVVGFAFGSAVPPCLWLLRFDTTMTSYADTD